MMVEVEYRGQQFQVDLETLAVKAAGVWSGTYFNKTLGRWYVIWDSGGRRYKAVPRARLICLAAHPQEGWERLQADHVNSNPSDDRPENLRWLTRRQNNSTAEARRRKSAHATNRHRGEDFWLIAGRPPSGGKWRVFRGGGEAAKAIGCSSPLVYYALSPDHYMKRAKGWELRWLKPGDAEWARAAGEIGGQPGEEARSSRYNQKAPPRRGQRRHTA